MPMLLVTTKPGKEHVVEEEIPDCLYRLDPAVRVERTVHGGVLKVHVNIPSREAARAVKRCWVSHVNRVVPVDEAVAPSLEAVVEAALRLAGGIKGTIAVRMVKRRGKLGSTKQVEEVIGAALKERLGLTIKLDDPDYELRIEELAGEVLLAILSREDRAPVVKPWPPTEPSSTREGLCRAAGPW